MSEAGVMAEPAYRDPRAQNLAKARAAKAAKREEAQSATEENPISDKEEALPGHVFARVLKGGHGRIHTGALTENGGAILPPKLSEQDFMERRGEDWRKAYDLAFAQAASEIGMTYQKGAVIQLPQQSAERYEERGWVEIVDGA